MIEHKDPFYGYVAGVEVPGHQPDPFQIYFMGLALRRRLTIYAGKEVWTNDDTAATDIILAFIHGNFIPTKVGKCVPS